jgi:hypothetical protein
MGSSSAPSRGCDAWSRRTGAKVGAKAGKGRAIRTEDGPHPAESRAGATKERAIPMHGRAGTTDRRGHWDQMSRGCKCMVALARRRTGPSVGMARSYGCMVGGAGSMGCSGASRDGESPLCARQFSTDVHLAKGWVPGTGLSRYSGTAIPARATSAASQRTVASPARSGPDPTEIMGGPSDAESSKAPRRVCQPARDGGKAKPCRHS